ncbi:MAG TPA: DNA gyrase inhibitor YacG [Burkholderiaceae bacterium]|nr:DNA gyrase inhibitor YacG [Burkholderiaceae bacterium]
MTASAPARLVPCPTCARRAAFSASNPWRPFCGERCRSIDLGAWASERFRVPADSPPEGAEGFDAGTPTHLPGG